MRMKTLETLNCKGERTDYQVTNVGAVPGAEAFLFVTERSAFLLDSGFGFCGEQTADNVDRVLNGRKLDRILLTHSHYDHILGSPYVAERHPEAEIVASRHTAEVIEKHGARRTMRSLDASAARMSGMKPCLFGKVGKLRVDRIVGEGDTVDFDDLSFRVYEFPGHTFCSIGFYCESERLLLSCETLGVYVGNDTCLPIFLVGYKVCLASLEKAQKLDVGAMLIPHTGMVFGDLCGEMLLGAERDVRAGVDIIVRAAGEGMTEQQLVDLFMDRFYTEYARKLTPEDAFRLNAGYMVNVIMRELCRT